MTEKDKKRNVLRRRAEVILELQPETIKEVAPHELRQVVHELHVHQIELEIQNEELLETQKTLEKTRTRYVKLYNHAPVGYVVLDRSGIIKQANETFGKMVSRESNMLPGKAFVAFIMPEDETIFRSRLRAFFKNPVGKHMDLRFKRNNTEIFYGSLRAVIGDITQEAPAPELLITVTDISIRKKLEARLAHAAKMETVATLSGGIAHDYNNLLAAILGNIELLRDDLGPSKRGSRLLAELENASLKARDLTQEFMLLARGGAPSREIGSMKELLEDAVGKIPSHSRVQIEMHLDHDLWEARFNDEKMGSALTNIITNGVESMPGGGVLTVTAHNFTFHGEEASLELPLTDGDYVRIFIQDQGVGIPDMILAKIFDPYFSTKEMGSQKGMGLGLATAYATIQKHNGHIEVDSKPGKGTCITVYLPAESGTGRSPGPESVMDKHLSGLGRILVMDDEEMLRNLATLMLKSLGLDSDAASDGAEALIIYKEAMNSPKPFDAVILDLTVKDGMGGQQTIKKLLQMDPNVKAIVSSGYFDDPVMTDFKAYGFHSALPKPYRKQDLKDALKAAMD